MAKHTILIVEDDDTVRLTLRDFLKQKDFDVLVASDGVGALKLLIDNEPSLIVTDYRMNILGGDYWVRFLQRFCPDTPVFVMSGFLKPNFDIPYPVVAKPFDYGELAEKISDVL